MRFSIICVVALFAAAFAVPLNPPSDEGVIAATTSIPTVEQDDGLGHRHVSDNPECVDVLHYHGVKRIERLICNKKDLKAFEKWSKKQALKDDAKVLRRHQEVVLRWAEKKMDMRNGSMSLVDRKDFYGKKIPVRGWQAATMLSRAVYWSPKKWLKKYKKQVKILNEAQELYEKKLQEQVQQQIQEQSQGGIKNQTENPIVRRDASAESDCVDVTYDHGVGVLTRRLCTKKEKKDFQKWEEQQMERDHIFIHRQHLERELRRLEKKLGLREGAFSHSGGRSLRDGHPTHKELISDYKILQDAKYMPREKWFKKYKKQAAVFNMSQELDDSTTIDDGPLAKQKEGSDGGITKEKGSTISRRDTSAQSDCVDVTYDHGMGEVTRRLCTNKEKKEFEKWELMQMTKDHKALRKQHVDRQMRRLEQKMGLRRGAFSHSGGRHPQDGITTTKDLIDDGKMMRDARYMTREKWLEKYKNKAAALNRTQELEDSKFGNNGTLARRDVPVQLGADHLFDTTANVVPGSPIPNDLKHELDSVEQDGRALA